jgi:hypothetical protein
MKVGTVAEIHRYPDRAPRGGLRPWRRPRDRNAGGGRSHDVTENTAEANIILGAQVMAGATRALIEREAREGL